MSEEVGKPTVAETNVAIVRMIKELGDCSIVEEGGRWHCYTKRDNVSHYRAEGETLFDALLNLYNEAMKERE